MHSASTSSSSAKSSRSTLVLAATVNIVTRAHARLLRDMGVPAHIHGPSFSRRWA